MMASRPSINGYKHLECRYLRHAWTEIEIDSEMERPYYEIPKNAVYERVSCMRCGTVRGRWIDNKGERYAARYYYPSDYRIEQKEGQENPKPVDFRIAMYKRVTVRR